jgi:hypothetical protein
VNDIIITYRDFLRMFEVVTTRIEMSRHTSAQRFPSHFLILLYDYVMCQHDSSINIQTVHTATTQTDLV